MIKCIDAIVECNDKIVKCAMQKCVLKYVFLLKFHRRNKNRIETIVFRQ